MTKYALTVGVNRYPSSPLQGCLNDARDWQQTLEARGFDVHPLHDEQATKPEILRWLAGTLEACDRDDLFVFTWSGHGTRVPDQDGDEVDGWDEAICAYPAQRRSDMVLDDELYALFAPADARGVRVVAVSDSCHSGTLQRLAPALTERPLPICEPETHAADEVALEGGDHGYRAARWLSPAEWMSAEDLRHATPAWAAPRGVSRRSALVLAACRPDQVAYDAFLDGRYRGAFTAAALDALDSIALPDDQPSYPLNYRTWHKAIRARLPSVDFDSVPQLDGTSAQRRWLLFQEQGRR